MINFTIDGKPIQLEEPESILNAAKRLGIEIPTLCYHEKLSPYGGCRICLVEAAPGSAPERSKLVPACASRVEEGLIIKTSTQRVREARKFNIELLLSRSPDSEEIRQTAREIGVDPDNRSALDSVGEYLLYRAPRIRHTKCILCGLCVRVCAEITERDALCFENRGMKRRVVPPFDKVADTCIGCGSCAYVCSTNTITIEEVT